MITACVFLGIILTVAISGFFAARLDNNTTQIGMSLSGRHVEILSSLGGGVIGFFLALIVLTANILFGWW